MKRLLAVLGVLLCVATDGVRAEEPDKPTYVIETRILGADSDGKETVLAAPKVAVFEDQGASIRIGSEFPRPGNTNEVELLHEGTAIDVKIFCDKDGQRFLDAKLTLTGQAPPPPVSNVAVRLLTRFVPDWLWQPAREEPVGIRLVSTGARLVEPLKLGEKVVVPIGGEGPQRVEMRVTEMVSDERASARPEPSLILGGVTPRIIVQNEEEERLGILPQP